MADQPIPLRRYLAANTVALAPSAVAIAALYGWGFLAGRPALIAMAGIAAVTAFLVQRYLGSLARFARFVGELSDEREPVMPRLSFAPATEELAPWGISPRFSARSSTSVKMPFQRFSGLRRNASPRTGSSCRALTRARFAAPKGPLR